MSNQVDAESLVKRYVELGWSLIPVRHDKKSPACKSLDRYRQARVSADEALDWLDAGHRLGAFMGEISGGLYCRDFDDLRSYERWAAHHSELAKQMPTVQTRRGRHVYGIYDAARFKKLSDGELRAGCHWCIVPPSQYHGGVYRWLIGFEHLQSIDPASAGLCSAWDIALSDTEYTDTTSVHSVDSVHSVSELQEAAIEEAICRTTPIGYGNRRDCLFEFARRIMSIVQGKPTMEVSESLAVRWYRHCEQTFATKDIEVTVADLWAAFQTAKFGHGDGLLREAYAKSVDRPVPAFSVSQDPFVPSARLARLVCQLDEMHGGGTWFLSCRAAAELCGMTHTAANRVLKHWEAKGVLRVAFRGSPGPPGSKANRFQLLWGK